MEIKTLRGTAWSITCNMKTISRATVEACMESARSLGWGVEGQIEKGEEGTEHFQLLVRTPQVRFSAVKKVFPSAHIELARNVKALEQYVHKEETRVESLRSVEVTFLTYPMVRKKFFTWFVDTYPERIYGHPDHDECLVYWDRFIGLSIEEGMEVDLIGMNPQHRGCISKYWRSYIVRESSSRQTEVRRQDSQTDIQEVTIPSCV